jgi:hypothetical protein
MSVRRYEPGAYQVTNLAHSSQYLVRFERRAGSIFGTCTCKAGTPGNHRAPLVCKHLFVAVLFHNAIAAMRRAPAALAAGEQMDGDD